LVWVNDGNRHKDVYYTKSIDEGSSFSEPVRINSHANTVVAYIQSGPSLSVMDNNIDSAENMIKTILNLQSPYLDYLK